MAEGMTREERDRLVVLETKFSQIEESMAAMDEKLDKLVAAANMGKGAWWLLLKIGGVLTVVGGAGAWLYDRFVGIGPHP